MKVGTLMNLDWGHILLTIILAGHDSEAFGLTISTLIIDAGTWAIIAIVDVTDALRAVVPFEAGVACPRLLIQVVITL